MNVTIIGFEKSWCGSSNGILIDQITSDQWQVEILGGKHNKEIFVLSSAAFIKNAE